MTTEYVAKCEQCGRIASGPLEEVDDAVERHEQFHDVRISRVATDGGTAHGRGQSGRMDKVTIRLPTPQVADLETLVERGAYPNRSEAIRAAVHEFLDDRDVSMAELPRDPEYLRPDGGRRLDQQASRRRQRRDAEARDGALERRERREVTSQQREGQTADQGPCPHADAEDVLPCPTCFGRGGEE